LVVKDHRSIFRQCFQRLETEMGRSGTTVQGNEGWTTSTPYNLIPNLPTGNVDVAFLILLCQLSILASLSVFERQ